ncbi:hypothetical protein EON82_05735 [bacterium]|nr:MAG: hypothetical protein EON82_05735 [bacterium]
MERREQFASGDNNTSNGNSLEQKEASADVFEAGQRRSNQGPVRPMKDGEEYVYGDSRPDRTEPSDTFEAVDEHPMMTTTRENLPEAHKEDPAFLESHRVDQRDEIAPHLRKDDPNQSEEAVLIEQRPTRSKGDGV